MPRLLVFLCLVTAISSPGFGQGADNTLSFEVASVKLVTGAVGPRWSAYDPGRYSVQYTLNQLIADAYDVRTDEVLGGPSWAGTEYYEVEGKAPGGASKSELKLMLRSLLADRFQLRAHMDRRPLPFNVLSVAPGGPKFGPQFHESKDEGAAAAGDPRKTVQQFSHYSMSLFCSVIHTRLLVTISNGVLIQHAQSASDIPYVLDQTGLSGTYDITVDTSSGADWRGLLEHHLGLKLQERKVPVDVVVIDSVTRPSAN